MLGRIVLVSVLVVGLQYRYVEYKCEHAAAVEMLNDCPV